MVIWFVSQGHALLLYLPPILAVRLLTCRGTGRNGVVLEDLAHVVEQIGDGQEHIGPVTVMEVRQEKLCILVSLEGRLREPVVRLLPVLRYFFAHQVQLTSSYLLTCPANIFTA